MTTVILTIHTLLVLALVGVVLLQRSEGGALGMGGGGGGGFMSGRGAANVLTRTTTVLAALFFSTSMVLALLADRGTTQDDILRSLTGEEATESATEPADGLAEDDILDLLGTSSATPEAPATESAAPVSEDAPVEETDTEGN